MFEKIKQIFHEWFENAVDDEIEVKIPYKYRDLKIEKIIIEERSYQVTITLPEEMRDVKDLKIKNVRLVMEDED